MFYITFLILLSVYLFRNKIHKNIKILLVTLPLMLMISVRFGMGTDYFSYEYIYNNLDVSSLSSLFSSQKTIEIGYRLLQFPFVKLGIPYQVYLITINTLMLFLVTKWILDNSDHFELSYLLFYAMFFVVWILSALRQGLVLVIGSYLLFNWKIKLKTHQKIIVILLLSTVHYSALFYLILLLIPKIKWNRTYHLYFLFFSLLTTFLPIHRIVDTLSFIPLVSYVSTYLGASQLGFFDVQSLSRLFFFVVIIAHYDRLKHQTHMRMMMDLMLSGYSFYFLFKFSEITASRLTIFTHILIIFIFPAILTLYKNKLQKRLNYVLVVGLVLMSGLYLEKDLLAMRDQSLLTMKGFYIPLVTIHDKDYTLYESYFAMLSRLHAEEEIQLNYYREETNLKRHPIDYREGDTYNLVSYSEKEGHNYLVLNQEGNILTSLGDVRAELFGTTLVERDEEGIFGNAHYRDLSSRNRSVEIMKSEIFSTQQQDFAIQFANETVEELDVQAIPEAFRDYFLSEALINRVQKSTFTVPFKYSILEIDYQTKQFYIYLDEKDQPMFSFMSQVAGKFNSRQTLNLSLGDGLILVNRQGQIIWWNGL